MMAKVEIESVQHPGKIKRVRPREAKVLVALGRFRYRASGVVAPAAGPAVTEERDPFAGVDFASDVAYEAARSAQLTAGAFEGRSGTGRGGAFTKADVLALIEDHA